jgi:hypothetical protein
MSDFSLGILATLVALLAVLVFCVEFIALAMGLSCR